MRRILIVDDEPLIAIMIQRVLEPGCAVQVVTSGRAAYELLARGERFDVIISDLHMDDGDGIWLHQEVSRLDAGQARRMLFLSGAPDEFLERPGVRSLPKPFRGAELLAQVEAAATS